MLEGESRTITQVYSIFRRPFAACLLAALCFAPALAQASFRVTPGLLHSGQSFVRGAYTIQTGYAGYDEPATTGVSLRNDFRRSSLPTAGLPVSHSTLSSFASTCTGLSGMDSRAGKASGPVGASRYLQISDDPNCDQFWGPDKWRHVGVFFGGTVALYLFFKTVFKTSKGVSYLISAVLMSAVGLAREISDSNSEKNCFSEQDLFANSVGILTAGLVIAIF